MWFEALSLSRCAGKVGSGREGDSTCLVVDGLGVASSLQRGPDGGRTRSEGCTGDAEGVHDDVVGQLMCSACKQSESCPRPVGLSSEPASNFPNPWHRHV